MTEKGAQRARVELTPEQKTQRAANLEKARAARAAGGGQGGASQHWLQQNDPILQSMNGPQAAAFTYGFLSANQSKSRGGSGGGGTQATGGQAATG